MKVKCGSQIVWDVHEGRSQTKSTIILKNRAHSKNNIRACVKILMNVSEAKQVCWDRV